MQFDGNMQPCGLWRLVREIGHGAYGVVYLAAGSDGERAAVKVCRRNDLGDERYERELRGARLYSAIPRTAGLVRMKELVEEPWGFYSVMDLADHEFDGEFSEETYRPKTLASILGGVKALSLDESLKLGIALTKGLEVLQRHHLLHRDIKPGNVVYVGGRPVLSDPGLVVEESDAASLVGTPGYVPPEKFTAATSDIYSLGLTLKAACFGRCVEDLGKGPALEADTSAKFFNAWWRILNKATDEDPRRRYQSAKALLKDLEGLRRKIALASIAGSRAAKAMAFLAALGVVSAIVFAVVARQAAGTATVYERALRENFGGILSEERIKEEAQKALAGEKTGLTPDETKAFRKKIGLGELMDNIKDATDSLTGKGKDLDK